MKLIYLTIFTSVVLTICGCKSNHTKETGAEKADTSSMIIQAAGKKAIKKVFFNLPSPIEWSQNILSTQVPFKGELLNPTSNLEKYSTTSSLALNFGVYGTDLCYCRTYEQIQASINYLSAIRKISEKLQIPEDEGSRTINQIEKNIDNRDSVFQIIADSYANADGYLKENERDKTAVFILIGGWVEGMYFAVNMTNPELAGEKLKQQIAAQKYSLDNLISLALNYKDDQTIQQILIPLNQLKKEYDSIKISQQNPVVVTDQETNVTTIDNPTQITVSKQQIDEITQLINKIRGIIIS